MSGINIQRNFWTESEYLSITLNEILVRARTGQDHLNSGIFLHKCFIAIINNAGSDSQQSHSAVPCRIKIIAALSFIADNAAPMLN